MVLILGAGLLAVGAGGLPEAQPVAVGSEAELRSELERVVAQLAPAVEWTQRVDALLRLEGLVMGGAAGFAGFSELLLGLRDALTAQVRMLRADPHPHPGAAFLRAAYCHRTI